MPSGYNITNINGVPYVVYPDGTTYSTTGGKVDANCTLAVCPLSESIYGYRPSLPGSATLIALFAIVAIVQLGLGIKFKSWGYMTCLILGCIDEILGYVARILYWANPWNGSSFVMQIVTITIGPVFFCAAIYVMIYKIINYIDVTKARFNPKLIYWVFISCDVISLVLQSAGGGLSSDASSGSKYGVSLALAGLAFQVATLGIFIIVCSDYAFRSRTTWRNTKLPKAFLSFVGFLTLAVVTIFIRCCYRVYELQNGYSRDSAELRDQGLFIGLESVMIIVAAFATIGSHPGFVFDKQGKTASNVEEEKITNIDGSTSDSS